MRLRKIPGVREKLAAYPQLVTGEIGGHRGGWHAFFGNDNPIHLEIGMGRGKFLDALSQKTPGINYVAIELRPEVIYVAAKRIGDRRPNVRILETNAMLLPEIFAAGEVERIYLNFSDPWPKKRHQKRRLTHRDFLSLYLGILCPGGDVLLRTDAEELMAFTCQEMAAMGFTMVEYSADFQASPYSDGLSTEYEDKKSGDGPIFYGRFRAPEGRQTMYISTRGQSPRIAASKSIHRGLAEGGGLFVPETVPVFPAAAWEALPQWGYRRLAKEILGLYLDDYSEEEIAHAVDAAYGANYHSEEIAPLVSLGDRRHILELWHGPTAAFKDMALQILPYLLTAAIAKSGSTQEVVILVATSGDTGKAALEGFADVPGTKIIVFYPKDGVSEVQRLQMVTTTGNNTHVVAVDGNFDDCQRGVKAIFNDKEFAAMLAGKGYAFSSANSINWGRLLPQIVYYFWAYGRLLKNGAVAAGEEIDIVVPTGNFGNILAAYYGKRMGLPVAKLVCASNRNRVLTDVLCTGVYDRNREFYRTSSPSMDILVSSNFERFLFALSGSDETLVADAQKQLETNGIYGIPPSVFAKMRDLMVGYCCDEEETAQTIAATYKNDGYLLDPHTAVAVKALADYRRDSGSQNQAVVASTANPYKFNADVYRAVAGAEKAADRNEFQLAAALEALTGVPIHPSLQNLQAREVRHRTAIGKEEMRQAVADILSL